MGLHFVLALAHKFFDPNTASHRSSVLDQYNDLLAMTFNLQLLPASMRARRKEGGGATAVLTFDLAAFGLYLTCSTRTRTQHIA